MNPVSLGMDGLLILLLFAALTVGLRLDRKLKSLKASQAGFVKAVADLDLAAGRAEAGLEALRSATREAHDALLSRIETARTLSARLDRACEDAQAAATRAEASARRADERPAAPPPPLRLVDPAPAPGASPTFAHDDGSAAVLKLIESAREEAGVAAPPLIMGPTASGAASAGADGDRLARFVARRREARAR